MQASHFAGVLGVVNPLADLSADGSPEALYIVGYFVVSLVGLAASFTPAQLNEFSKNAHVREALTDQAAAFIFAPGRGRRRRI